jgi:hypothetical protein
MAVIFTVQLINIRGCLVQDREVENNNSYVISIYNTLVPPNRTTETCPDTRYR